MNSKTLWAVIIIVVLAGPHIGTATASPHNSRLRHSLRRGESGGVKQDVTLVVEYRGQVAKFR